MTQIGPVLHICESIRGGVASYLDEIGSLQVAEFGQRNVKFVVPQANRHELPNIPDECVIPIAYSERSAGAFVSYTRQIHRVLRQQEFNLVHAHSSIAGFVTRCFRATGTFRTPVIYCAHGWSFLMDVSTAKRRAYALAERVLAPFADSIISISQFEHDWALRVGLPAERCHLIRNGIGPARRPQKLDLPSSRINLLFAGRLDRQKGADVLLEAMRRLRRPDIHLYVAGGAVLGTAEVTDTENVTVLGWLSREELDVYYASVDALVMPSRWEGFGLSAVEAMRQSTAVIASDRGALPEIVIPGVTGLIVPADDPATLAALLEQLDKECLRQWGEAGFERQQALFSSSRVHDQLCKIYRALIGSSGNAAGSSNRPPATATT